MEKAKQLCCRLAVLLTVACFAFDVAAQTSIKGHVKDAAGEDIIGATVTLKDQSGGTITDFDGNFELQCKAGTKLVITYVGFNPQEVSAKDGMEVVLQ